jgi:heat shock protein HslJ
LEAATWRLDSYGDPESPSAVPDGIAATAKFEADQGQIAGKAGCNGYSGDYEVDGNSITIGPVATTLMMCEPEVMEVEVAFVAALEAAETFSADEGALEIQYGDGSVLRFSVLEPSPLEGTAWNLLQYNNGREAVVSLKIGTEITALFADGGLSGSSGCNTYKSEYAVEGDSISIGPAASTRMFCSDPEGVMDQEAEFLAALEMAETYSIEGDQLELRTADGALVAHFSASAR